MTRTAARREKLLAELTERFIGMLHRARVLDQPGLEEAFRSVPRHVFVDRYYDSKAGKQRLVNVDPKRVTPVQLQRIYRDTSLLSHRAPAPSSTSQPSLVAKMLRELRLKRGMKVLEIGAGTGWNAALMGHLVGPTGHVYSVDINPDVSRRARRHIRRLGIGNVTVVTADGFNGHRSGAPYDRVITTVACPDVFPAWSDQLRDGGVLLVTIQDMPATLACLLARLVKRKGHLRGTVVALPWFMVFRGIRGRPVTGPNESREGSRRSKRLAPWASWYPGANDVRLRDLLFVAYLEGMGVEESGREFVLTCSDSDSTCVTTDGHLEIFGEERVHDVLEAASRRWLELGVPSRLDYSLEVWPKHSVKRWPKTGWLVQRDHSQMIFRLKKSRE